MSSVDEAQSDRMGKKCIFVTRESVVVDATTIKMDYRAFLRMFQSFRRYAGDETKEVEVLPSAPSYGCTGAKRACELDQ